VDMEGVFLRSHYGDVSSLSEVQERAVGREGPGGMVPPWSAWKRCFDVKSNGGGGWRWVANWAQVCLTGREDRWIWAGIVHIWSGDNPSKVPPAWWVMLEFLSGHF
jgi:hypothetical protein